MVKRVLLAFTFVAALGAAGLGIGSKALAWHDCDSGYGYRGYGGYGYSAYYPSHYGYGYEPRVAYYPSYRYPVYYGNFDGDHHHDHHDHHHNGLSISFGF